MDRPSFTLKIGLIEDVNMNLDDDYVIMLQRDWNVMLDFLKLCKRAGVLEKQYERLIDTTVWPLDMKQ